MDILTAPVCREACFAKVAVIKAVAHSASGLPAARWAEMKDSYCERVRRCGDVISVWEDISFVGLAEFEVRYHLHRGEAGPA